MAINKAYTKDERKNGKVIQIKDKNGSVSFTVQTEKSPLEIRTILMDFINTDTTL